MTPATKRPRHALRPTRGTRRHYLGLVSSVVLTACAPATHYHWGQYEDSLYHRYASEDVAGAEASLRETIVTAELQSRVPPGVYADYGFLLYRRGDHAGAIANFEEEQRAFPESAALMAKLIERIREKQGTSSNAERQAVPAEAGQR